MKMIFTIFCLRHFLCQRLIFNRKTKFLAPLSKTKKFQHSKKSIAESRDFGTVYFRTVSSKERLLSPFTRTGLNRFMGRFGREKQAPYTQFLARPDKKGKKSNVPKLKVASSQKTLENLHISNIN